MKQLQAAGLLVLALLSLSAAAQGAGTADTILINGKIATVDDRFTMAQALAIKDRRVIATGSNDAVRKHAGASTKVIDLKGRTVIPGLIDNHSHWIRAAEHDELRFDGVTTRAQAVKMLAERLATKKPGEWVVVLGGWSEEQFTDEVRGFPLAELDAMAPNNPVVLQSIYRHSYLNSTALKMAKIDDSTPNPPRGTIEKDAAGKITGVVRGAGGVAFVPPRCRTGIAMPGWKTPASWRPISTASASPPGETPADAA